MQTVNPSISSSELFKTSVPRNWSPREWYIQNRVAKPPWIAYSFFLTEPMVEHLMRDKKRAAIGVKFSRNGSPPDRITNMEGALHTFVTPIINTTIHGDYQWRGGHSIFEFGSYENHQLGRRVLLSALVQQDYEDDSVMLQVCRLGQQHLAGSAHLPHMITLAEKQKEDARRRYDLAIKKYLVYHLTQRHQLPSSANANDVAISVDQAIDFLGQAICQQAGHQISCAMRDRYIIHRKHPGAHTTFLSIEMMFHTAFYQIKNEFYTLEKICPHQGYVYSFNPSVIFVRYFGTRGTKLLNRINIAALKYLASAVSLPACKGIIWDDFGSPESISLIRTALSQRPHIQVQSRTTAFGNKFVKPKASQGLYLAPPGAENAMLVIHNNSDAFGQNIESEGPFGSLDGIVGSYSSAAASLLRHRKDLCHHLLKVPA